MANDLQPGAELEIAHVLFIDVVGYSSRLINEQAAVVAELNRIVRETPHFRAAEAANRLIRIPTGDGMALVFFNTPEAPVQCALELCQALRSHPDIGVRMGIHSGAVNSVPDVNDRPNVAGAGINIAQRIMDCADAGHILLSKRVAEDLAQYAHWRPKLYDLGEIEVKHGSVVSVVNLVGDGFGNASVPSRLQQSRRRSRERPVKRTALAAAAALGVVTLAALGWMLFRHMPARNTSAALSKSIAVLPFENLSDDKQNSYFADGIQDDILTALSKVSDLKVISRSSVARYRNTNRKLREISQELNVGNVLEGSVRRAGDEVRVTAQLIDARTDSHLWAEHYDRKISDIFAIQSEIAENIAEQLRATLSPAEKAAITAQPTNDLEAFDLFLQARTLINNAPDSANQQETLVRATRLLDEATSRDPNFALAYSLAAIAHDNLYWFDYDHTPARLQLAETNVHRALQVAPELGEAHLAQALIFYHGYRDYAQARQHLAFAKTNLPNDPSVYSITGYIDRREGKWADSLRNLQRAAELDPRNLKVLNDLSVLYDLLHQYDEKEQLIDRAATINPAQRDYWQLIRAGTELSKGELAQAQHLLDDVPPQYDPNGGITALRIAVLLYEGNVASAQSTLDQCKLEELTDNTGQLQPRAFFAGLVARARGDQAQAAAAFQIARQKIEELLRDDPDNGMLLSVLGLIDAGLGKKEEAVAEGRRAAELRPVSKDAVDGPVILTRLAMIYSWVGDNDAAIEQLSQVATLPSGPDYGQLRFDPAWNGLRKDPRFAKIVEALQPRRPRK